MNNTNKHNNGSPGHYLDNEDNSTPGTIVIINCVLNAPLMLISILGNALVLAAIIRTPSICSTSMIMLCSLVVSDLLVGLFVQSFYIAEQLTKDHYVRYITEKIGFSLCAVSLMTITAIAVDRFLALHYHMRYATLVTKSRVKFTLVVIWLISVLVSGFDVLSPRIQKPYKRSYYHLCSNFHIFLPQNLSHCSSASVTNPRSTTGSAKFKC